MATAPLKRNRRPAGTWAAANEADDLGRSQGRYSQTDRGASRLSYFERLCLGQIRPLRRNVDRPFRRDLLRQREIEWVIEYRYGRSLPEQDGDEFFRAIAHALQAAGLEVLVNLKGWCSRWAPWALQPEYAETLVIAAESVRRRTHDLRADAVAKLLRVTMAERVAVGLRTIGAYDVSRAKRSEIMKGRKMESDRERQRSKRKADGRQSRDAFLAAHCLSRLKPWQALGMSRAKFYRLRKAGETSVSRVEDIGMCDTPVSSASKPVIEECLPAAQAVNHIQTKNCTKPVLRRVAKPPQRSEEAQQSAASPKGAAVVDPAIRAAIEAAFRRLHDPNTRWLPAPGSSTDMIAA